MQTDALATQMWQAMAGLERVLDGDLVRHQRITMPDLLADADERARSTSHMCTETGSLSAASGMTELVGPAVDGRGSPTAGPADQSTVLPLTITRAAVRRGPGVNGATCVLTSAFHPPRRADIPGWGYGAVVNIGSVRGPQSVTGCS